MKLPERTFERKYKSQHGRCFYCGGLLYENHIEIDHFIPISEGGSGQTTNLVLVCKNCNRIKSDKPLSYLRNYLIDQGLLIRDEYFYFEFLNLEIIK